MTASFPELNSFGTLFRFAIEIEATAARVASESAAQDAANSEWLLGCAKKHNTRKTKLERIQRERLNEVVLQAISGMDRDTYVSTLSASGHNVAGVIAVEKCAAEFYRDAARVAAEVLGGVEKILNKLAAENDALAAELAAFS